MPQPDHDDPATETETAPAADAEPAGAADAGSAEPAALRPTEAGARAARWRRRLRRWGGPFAVLACLLGWALFRSLPARDPRASSATAAEPQQPAQAEPAPLRLRGERVLRGRVIDDRDLPLADARLRVSSLDQPGALPWEARSDQDGRFVLEGLVPHALSIEVTREGHDGSERVLRAEDADELTFQLARQGELLVVLRDAPGQAVDAALVTLTGPGLWPAAQQPAGATGEVLFTKLAFGEYRARARRGGRVALPSDSVRVVPGERAELELSMEQGVELTAQVFDRADKAPIAQAQLTLFDPSPGIPPLSVESGPDGSLHVPGLLPGALRVEVTHAGHAPRSLDVVLPSAEPLQLGLDGEASLSGSVVDDRGQPLAGALLSVATRDGLPVQLGSSQAPGPARVGELGVTQGPVPRIPIAVSSEAALGTLAAQSDAQGAFRIAGLSPAPVVLSAARSGYVAGSLEIGDLAPHAERAELRIVLREAGTVEGHVRDLSGQPVSGVYVSAHCPLGAEQSAITDDSGRFSLLDVLGDVKVEATPQGSAPLSCQVQVAARSSARCELTVGAKLHELALRVVDEYGFGVEGAVISVTARGGQRSFTQVSRRDGSARLRELPDPPYHVEAALKGFVTSAQEVTELPSELRVPLRRAGSLAGVVTDALGRPVPNAFVSTGEGEASTETDARGSFLLTGVTPGALSVWALHRIAGEGQSGEVRARAGETLASLRIVLSGRYLPGADGEPHAPAAAARPERAPAHREPRIKHADFELDQRGGKVLFTELAPGGAAERQGLRAGDALLGIDGEAVLSAAQARGMLRDPPGRAASLKLLRQGSQLRLRYRRPELGTAREQE